MNDRFTELRQKAHARVELWVVRRNDKGIDVTPIEFFSKKEEKLAELIVKECAVIAAGERSGWEARKQIEETFGVK